MPEDRQMQETAARLRRLVEASKLSRDDDFIAQQCLRRLEKPLRMAVFGTDPRHAISLINLMIGQSVIAPSTPRARIQFVHGEKTQARLQFRDGSQKRLEGEDFRNFLDDNPTRIRLQLDLPVLKKLSIMLATESDPHLLCADAEKSLAAADIALWTGGELVSPMDDVWKDVPDRLRGHSYLVLSQSMDLTSWEGIADDFVEVLRVDPRRAQAAKTREKGVDKVAFKEAGGVQIVKTIKKEIELLVQSALDASEVLLLRYADALDKLESKIPAEATRPSEAEIDDILQRAADTPPRRQVYSVPLGKVGSGSRQQKGPAQSVEEKPTQRQVSLSLKNMPKKEPSRNVSKTGSKARVRSRKSAPAATPWSLGI